MKALFLIAFLAVSACSPLGLLTGGGPNVAANVQAGKENTQQLVANQTTTEVGGDYTVEEAPIKAEKIEKINIQQTPFWVVVLLILGWLLPSPNEIARWIRGLFGK